MTVTNKYRFTYLFFGFLCASGLIVIIIWWASSDNNVSSSSDSNLQRDVVEQGDSTLTQPLTADVETKPLSETEEVPANVANDEALETTQALRLLADIRVHSAEELFSTLNRVNVLFEACLLYTSDAADES